MRLATPPEPGSGHALLVEIGTSRGVWTPIHARASLIAKLTYASDGDVLLQRERSAVAIGAGDRVVRVTGELEVDDVTWGLVSRLAYLRRLGRRLGADVGEALLQSVY